jgi:class 3 adenylate cyclase/CheY-like chemotaxis protein
VDDNLDSLEILETRLASLDYDVAHAMNGEEAISKVQALNPDLILLDIMMPEVDGLEVCRRIRANKAIPFIPIILVTAKSTVQDVVSGLEAGADDYLTKPVDHAALVARVRSILRIKKLQDEVQAQKARLAEWNRMLEHRVQKQVDEIERMARLRRFLSPHVADLVISSGDADLLGSHRALIAVLFGDLRGFTSFCDSVEPEEAIDVLQTYHDAMSRLIYEYDAGVDHRSGDGVMVIFNDPLPCDDPAGDALRMALAMRDNMASLCSGWRRLGQKLGFGVGISVGYATVGIVGSEGRYDYTASGTAVNLAARLCDEADDREILLSPRAYAAVEEEFVAESIGERNFKGIHEPVEVFRVNSN